MGGKNPAHVPARIGVLAMQGAFAEHIAMLRHAGATPTEVRLPSHLDNIDGLIIPGGESTSISLLMAEYKLFEPIEKMGKSGFPIWGTCAGLIMVSRAQKSGYPRTLGLADIGVRRNAYGRQVDSFEADLRVPALGEKPFHGIFIRAPRISEAGPSVEVLSEARPGEIVAARQASILCTSFHPELSGDPRFHQLFLSIVSGST